MEKTLQELINTIDNMINQHQIAINELTKQRNQIKSIQINSMTKLKHELGTVFMPEQRIPVSDKYKGLKLY